MAFKFENLIVWQKALDFDDEINNLVKKFPREEVYVLSSQMKRAADSIVLNIAEGSTGQSNPEFNKFLGYALRSAIEVVACLHIAKRREFINQNTFSNLYSNAEEIIKMTQALRNSLRKK
ncbi:MAG: four helix bundle protein [Bacteroidales bacterium]|nr:four helix bundle protein [Bacteroidales bacterium]